MEEKDPEWKCPICHETRTKSYLTSQFGHFHNANMGSNNLHRISKWTWDRFIHEVYALNEPEGSIGDYDESNDWEEYNYEPVVDPVWNVGEQEKVNMLKNLSGTVTGRYSSGSTYAAHEPQPLQEAKKPMYQYAFLVTVVLIPTQVRDLAGNDTTPKGEVITPPTAVVAANATAARTKAIRALTEEQAEQLEKGEIQVIVSQLQNLE